MKGKNLLSKIMLGVVVLSLSACNGIMSGMYDEPSVAVSSDYGFVKIDDYTKTGTIYINASEYTRWTYINFHDKTIDTLDVNTNTPEPAKWDIAVHRYDTKTNGGAVLETGFTGFDALLSSNSMPDGVFVSDIWTTDKIAIDMSGMMDGVILYNESYYNTELSKWLDVDTSTMPPVYTLSKKVYLVKLEDGTCVALRLSNFMNSASVKGYMTIEYMYPVEF